MKVSDFFLNDEFFIHHKNSKLLTKEEISSMTTTEFFSAIGEKRSSHVVDKLKKRGYNFAPTNRADTWGQFDLSSSLAQEIVQSVENNPYRKNPEALTQKDLDNFFKLLQERET